MYQPRRRRFPLAVDVIWRGRMAVRQAIQTLPEVGPRPGFRLWRGMIGHDVRWGRVSTGGRAGTLGPLRWLRPRIGQLGLRGWGGYRDKLGLGFPGSGGQRWSGGCP